MRGRLKILLQQVDCGLAIAEQFGDERLILNALQEKGKQIRLVQRTKAESDVAVAAASILARAEFLQRLQKLALDANAALPKGAWPAVKLVGRMFVKKHGREHLSRIAKLHFRTTKQVLGET